MMAALKPVLTDTSGFHHGVLMQLTRLLYISVADLADEADAIPEILSVARQFNSANGLTGILTYDGEYFTQVLEGPYSLLEQLMTRIAADTRHHDVRVLQRERVEERLFAQWHMAYVYDSDLNEVAATLMQTRFPEPEVLEQFILDVRASRKLKV